MPLSCWLITGLSRHLPVTESSVTLPPSTNRGVPCSSESILLSQHRSINASIKKRRHRAMKQEILSQALNLISTSGFHPPACEFRSKWANTAPTFSSIRKSWLAFVDGWQLRPMQQSWRRSPISWKKRPKELPSPYRRKWTGRKQQRAALVGVDFGSWAPNTHPSKTPSVGEGWAGPRIPRTQAGRPLEGYLGGGSCGGGDTTGARDACCVLRSFSRASSVLQSAANA